MHQPSPNGATNNSGKKQSTISIISTCTEPDVRILLVEDNLINGKVISLAIRKLGYIVSTACDGEEAL